MKKIYKTLFIAAAFSISMAYLEATVVVYLREIYYPEGFDFPLKVITPYIYYIEIGREIATIIMLFTFSYIFSQNKNQTFAYFCYNFGIWDIFYYIWIKLLLNWPESLFTWDVLFLIPLPWIAPVLAPLLVSVALIFAAVIILKYEEQFKFSVIDWIFEIIIGCLIIVSFLFQTENLTLQNRPSDYPWWLFISSLSTGMIWFIYRTNIIIKKS